MEKQTNIINPGDYAAIFFVRDLEKQVLFYTETIGLNLQWKNERQAGLGGCKSNFLLLTTEQKEKINSPLQIDLPTRRELAKVVGRFCTVKFPSKSIDYGDRHETSVTDPEGNAIVITVKIAGKNSRTPEPLDIESLFNELDPEDRLCDKMSEQTRVNQQLG